MTTFTAKVAGRGAGGSVPAKLAERGPLRVPCDARLVNGGRCTRKSEPGKKRCRYHGGRSTGPRTPEGKARCTANLPNRKRADGA